MSESFCFYDLETSGIKPGKDRVLQFAAIKTDINLNQSSEEYNIKVKLPDDVLPSPEAALVNKINVEDLKDGLSEAEFANLFNNDIATPDTIFVGFNNLRFDDEFMRYVNYRSFYDPYKWHWENGRSRWDIIDLVRMTRALRPEGINWPVVDGKNSNKLELLTKANNLSHESAHDALSDVKASIEVAKLLRDSNPRLFNFLFTTRSKKEANKLVNTNKVLVYTSGRYTSEKLNTTLVYVLDTDLTKSVARVYDLRDDPTVYLTSTPEELASMWKINGEEKTAVIPLKTIKLNRCPAIAPISVLNDESISRLDLEMNQINKNIKVIEENLDLFKSNLKETLKILDQQEEKFFSKKVLYPDEQLYSRFTSNQDAANFAVARKLGRVIFKDPNLVEVYHLYKARNFPGQDNTSDAKYRQFVNEKLLRSGVIDQYIKDLQEKISITTSPEDTKILDALLRRANSIKSAYEH